MSAPTPEERAEWREDAERYIWSVLRDLSVTPVMPRRILALLDALDETERERDAWKRTADVRSITALAERVARVRALADDWERADAESANRYGDPVTPSAFNRGYWHGLAESAADLRAALDGGGA